MLDDRKTDGPSIPDFIVSAMISCFFIFESSHWSSISIIVVTAILFIFYVVRNNNRAYFRICAYHKYVMVFVVYCFLSSVWSWDTQSTLSRSISVLLLFLCMSIVYLVYQDSSIDGLLNAIMISGVIISIYTIVIFGIDNLKKATEIGERLEGDNFYANVNAIGMWMSVCLTVFLHRILNTRFQVYYLLGILPVFMLAVVQSRTALIQAMAGIIIILFFKSKESTNLVYQMGRGIVSLLVLILLLYAITRFDVFSGINERMRGLLGLSVSYKEGSLYMRRNMIKLGLQQFLRTPILGIGFGSTTSLTSKYLGHYTYLHNNFIEVLVSGGIIGFFCYYSIHLFLFKSLWKKTVLGDKNCQLCLCLLVTHVLTDYGTVSYYKKATYVIITLCFLAVAIAKEKKND